MARTAASCASFQWRPGRASAIAASCASQHELVDRALLVGEAAIDRKRARDVGGVIAVLAARVDQQQVAVLQLRVVRVVVQDAGVGAAADDRVIGDARRACGGTRAAVPPSTSYSCTPGRVVCIARCAPRRRSAPRGASPPARSGSCRAACRAAGGRARRNRVGVCMPSLAWPRTCSPSRSRAGRTRDGRPSCDRRVEHCSMSPGRMSSMSPIGNASSAP